MEKYKNFANRTNLKIELLIIPVILCLTFIPGCRKSKPDYSVFVSNAKEIKPEAKVMWQGIHIGSVTDVEIENGKVRIDFDLLQKHKDVLRVGVKAKVMDSYGSLSTSVLRLFGGDNPSMPLLERYSQIPEASFFDTLSSSSLCEWLWTSHAKWCLLACVALFALIVFVFKILKGIFKFSLIILLLLLIAMSLFFTKDQWNRYKSSSPVSYTDVVAVIEHSLKNDETQKIWEAVKAEVVDSIKKTSETGIYQLESVKENINQRIQQKIDALRSQGKEGVIGEIKHDQSIIIDFLSNNE